MLTKEAFNALLKTLEEPPEFVKFILATTDPLKLPATILSRTQHFRFRKIPQAIVAKHLGHILNLEGVTYEPNALDIIARSGAGSVRDALTLLDQAIVYSKNFIDVGTVTNMLGIIEPSMLEALLNDIFQKNEANILAFINSAREFEAEMVIDELMLYLKEILLSGSSTITPMIIERFFRVLAEAKSLLNMGADGEFVLSLTLFKMMEALQIKEIDSMIRTLEKELSGVEVKATSPVREVMVPKVEVEKKVEEEQPPMITPEPVVEAPLDKSAKLFEVLVAKMYDRNYELGECFKHNIAYVSFQENLLTWESSASSDEKILLRNNWSMIRMFVQEIFGFENKIKNISKELPSLVSEPKASEVIQKRPHQEEAPVEPISMIEDEVLNSSEAIFHHNEPPQQGFVPQEEEPPMRSSCVAPEAGSTESAKEKDERSVLDEPMVAKALELFSPKKVRVKRKV